MDEEPVTAHVNGLFNVEDELGYEGLSRDSRTVKEAVKQVLPRSVQERVVQFHGEVCVVPFVEFPFALEIGGGSSRGHGG